MDFVPEKKNTTFLDKSVFFLLVILIALGVIAAILAGKAKIEQGHAKHITVWHLSCRNPSNEAYRLGMYAVIILAVAVSLHAIIMFLLLASFNSLDDSKRSYSRWASGFCLVCFLIGLGALFLILKAANSNNGSKPSCKVSLMSYFRLGEDACYLLSVFSTLALFCFFRAARN